MIHVPGVLRAAEEIQAFCQQRGWPFCFIGGVAVQRWAEPRLTQDVDLSSKEKARRWTNWIDCSRLWSVGSRPNYCDCF